MIAKFLIFMIRFYQRFVSPFKFPTCRFYPSCSSYAIDAIRQYGPITGSARALGRILRCHPWNPGGYDPVR